MNSTSQTNPSSLSNAELSARLDSINDALIAARSPWVNDAAYVATMQPYYDTLLVEWRKRFPSANCGAICG